MVVQVMSAGGNGDIVLAHRRLDWPTGPSEHRITVAQCDIRLFALMHFKMDFKKKKKEKKSEVCTFKKMTAGLVQTYKGL